MPIYLIQDKIFETRGLRLSAKTSADDEMKVTTNESLIVGTAVVYEVKAQPAPDLESSDLLFNYCTNKI